MKSNMFVLPVFQYRVAHWTDKKHVLLTALNNANYCGPDYDMNFVTNDYYQHSEDNVELATNIFEQELKVFLRDSGHNGCSISEAWFERANKGEFHPPHNHGYGYGAICYIEFDERHHLPLEFISPFLNYLDGNSLRYRPSDVEEGTIIFFPAPLHHFTYPNLIDSPRSVIAFNLNIHE